MSPEPLVDQRRLPRAAFSDDLDEVSRRVGPGTVEELEFLLAPNQRGVYPGELRCEGTVTRDRGRGAELAENRGCDLSIGHVVNVLIAVDRVKARNLHVIESEEHHPNVASRLDQVEAGTPLQTTP